MSARTFLLAVFIAFVSSKVVENDWRIYYDMDWKPVPLLPVGDLREETLRYGFIPCSCQDFTCGCCLRMNINFANFSRSGCMNFTYLPMDFAIEMNVLMNDESVFKRNVSAKNPPPACMEVPINYLPETQFCIKLFDIYTPGRNLHMCIDFETRISRAPVLVLQFDCIEMGCDGLSHVKPTQSSKTDVSTNVRKTVRSPMTKQWTGLCSTGEESESEGGEETGGEVAEETGDQERIATSRTTEASGTTYTPIGSIRTTSTSTTLASTNSSGSTGNNTRTFSVDTTNSNTSTNEVMIGILNLTNTFNNTLYSTENSLLFINETMIQQESSLSKPLLLETDEKKDIYEASTIVTENTAISTNKDSTTGATRLEEALGKLENSNSNK